MIRYTTTILQFGKQGEKTGWTYIVISAIQASKLKSGNKKSFRVKGKLDDYEFKGLALLPMGEGNFILPLNAAIRKAIKKRKDAKVSVQLEADDTFKIVTPKDILDCFEDEPEAKKYYDALPPSHRNYYIKWIDSAKSIETRARRIAKMLNAMTNKWSYSQMMQAEKANKI